jgi:hypothetical protein
LEALAGRADGNVVAVILIHHFVGVTVDVLEGDRIAESAVFKVFSRAVAALETAFMREQRIRIIGKDPRSNL